MSTTPVLLGLRSELVYLGYRLSGPSWSTSAGRCSRRILTRPSSSVSALEPDFDRKTQTSGPSVACLPVACRNGRRRAIGARRGLGARRTGHRHSRHGTHSSGVLGSQGPARRHGQKARRLSERAARTREAVARGRRGAGPAAGGAFGRILRRETQGGCRSKPASCNRPSLPARRRSSRASARVWPRCAKR